MKRYLLSCLSIALAASLLSACTGSGKKEFQNHDQDAKIPYTEGMAIEGAASVERQADHVDSPYFHAPDYFNMTSTDTLTLLPHFKTYQQTTEETCGTAAALMALEYFGLRGNQDDTSLLALCGREAPGIVTLMQLMRMFDNLGGFEMDDTYNYEDLDNITQEMLLENLLYGRLTLVEWCDRSGHWQVVIGYDTMGTPDETDDVLILADPYDTSDHFQDGYITISAERFFRSWANTYEFADGGQKKLFLAVWPREEQQKP